MAISVKVVKMPPTAATFRLTIEVEVSAQFTASLGPKHLAVVVGSEVAKAFAEAAKEHNER